MIQIRTTSLTKIQEWLNLHGMHDTLVMLDFTQAGQLCARINFDDHELASLFILQRGGTVVKNPLRVYI